VVRNQSGMGTKKTKAVKGDEKGEKKKSGLKKIL
jgi:hypothetical protein